MLLARDAGHTPGFFVELASITNKTDISSVADPYLRAFLEGASKAPADRLTMTGSDAIHEQSGTLSAKPQQKPFVNGKFETNTHSKEIPKS